jgi:MHS family alpha-ketoglutarate permease-like MFS transporter
MSAVSTTSGTLTTRLTSQQKKAILAGSVGNAVEWIDWALYATLAPVFAGQFFGSDDPAVNLLSTLAIFAVGFVMRPIGGAVLGAYADRHGR